jgi:CheY-like chemotaxis protein
MSHVAVLVVEDVPQVRATAVRIMEDLGCAVFDAYNGHHALKLLQAHPEIEVLFADIRMPGMNGPELANVARRLRPDLRIVLTSGYVSQDAVPDGIPFVPKPWRTGDLADVVDRARATGDWAPGRAA